MKHAHDRGKADGARLGRRSIAVATVTAAVAQMKHDGSDRPQPVTTLMGMVRLMAPIILAYRTSGWSDPQIVALLKERGFEIGVGTLTVYRHRLIRELAEIGVDPRPLHTDPPAAAVLPPPASQTDTADPEHPLRVSVSPAPQSVGLSKPNAPDGTHQPPQFNPDVDFDDIV